MHDARIVNDNVAILNVVCVPVINTEFSGDSNQQEFCLTTPGIKPLTAAISSTETLDRIKRELFGE